MDGKQELGSNLEMRVENSNDIIMIGNEDNCKEDDVIMKSRINDEDMDCKFFSPKQENLNVDKEDEVELESAKARMGEMKEENERLKTILEQIENNYKSLKLSFFDILTSPNKNKPLQNEAKIKEYNQDDVDDDEPEISLSLGLQTHRKPKKEDSNVSNTTTTTSSKKLMSESLSLGLELVKTHPSNVDLSNKRSERSDDETTMDDNEKDDGIRESWAQSNKVLKTMKDHSHEKEGETSQPSNTKRARVSVRVRCDTPTMNDGCQWRKYGQKLAKGNPCPRAYYRCTVAPSCPVRKQVQRCSEDTSILITTYEGTHNHPLSLVATSMASTTSAAASILLSGSSTSQPGLTSPAPTTVTSTNNSLNGINFTLYNNNNNPKPTNYANQYNLPISSSPNNAPPTITLDLTSTPSTIFNKRYPSPTNYNYSSKSLDFSSSQSKITFPNIGSSSSWSNNNNYLNYSLLSSTNNNNPSSISFGKPIYESITHHHHNPISNNNSSSFPSSSSSSSSSQQFLTETLAKVLTSDPSFQSAVAAAISSMVGSNNNLSNNSINTSSNNNNGANNGYNLMQNMKWGDQVQGILGNFLPNHLNNTTSSSSTSISSSSSSISQTTGNFINQHPQKLFPFTLTKNSSPPDLKD